LLDGLRGLVDESLGLLEAKTGRGADDLDHLDLLVACAREDDVDRGRALVGGGAVAGRCRAGCRGSRGDRGRRDAELLLERLDALGEVGDRDALELVDPFLGAGHYSCSPSVSEVSEVSFESGSGSWPGAPSFGSSSAGLSASGIWPSDSPTRPFSWIWPSATAMPESSALSVRARPEIGIATRATSWPCITSRLGRRE